MKFNGKRLLLGALVSVNMVIWILVGVFMIRKGMNPLQSSEGKEGNGSADPQAVDVYTPQEVEMVALVILIGILFFFFIWFMTRKK
ncbi:hypothetical protein ACFFGV_16900 [Pontibacillus salicampi]|uniref:LPXTG cell wall anchor domain-containing protein n=1 Tax=Pontibacillus salicampi TaxID=1449801 RepID=A0ABV6LSA0_9BACI